MDIKTALSRIVGHLDLSTAEMSDVMREIMTGQCTDAQIGAFMMAMRMKSESIDEIVGAVSVMRELADDTAQGSLDIHGKSLARAAALLEKVGEQLVALLGQDRFRVELHPFDIQCLVPQAHDLIDRAVFQLGPGRQFQALGQGFALDYQ